MIDPIAHIVFQKPLELWLATELQLRQSFCPPGGLRKITHLNQPQCCRYELLISRKIKYTLPKTNIAPENGPSQKETSLSTIHFQVPCSFQGGYLCQIKSLDSQSTALVTFFSLHISNILFFYKSKRAIIFFQFWRVENFRKNSHPFGKKKATNPPQAQLTTRELRVLLVPLPRLYCPGSMSRDGSDRMGCFTCS